MNIYNARFARAVIDAFTKIILENEQNAVMSLYRDHMSFSKICQNFQFESILCNVITDMILLCLSKIDQLCQKRKRKLKKFQNEFIALQYKIETLLA